MYMKLGEYAWEREIEREREKIKRKRKTSRKKCGLWGGGGGQKWSRMECSSDETLT